MHGVLCEAFCYKLRKSCESGALLSPFCDDDSDCSTALKGVQCCYFYLFYCLHFCLFFANLAALFVRLCLRDYWETTNHNCNIEISGLLSQMASQFSVVQSSFIFSKVAYGSSNQCSNIVELFGCVDEKDDKELEEASNPESPTKLMELIQTCLNISEDVDEEKESVAEAKTTLRPYAERNDIDQVRLYLLQAIDHQVLKRIRCSLEPYGTWFSFHWVLYSLSFFISLAALADTFSLLFYDAYEWYMRMKNDNDLACIFLLTLEHIFLFMYPCFRAVQVTATRERLIAKVFKKNWINTNMHVKMSLLDYMRAQNFGFRISLFWADITFGFHLALLSVFIGVFGAILKLAI